MLFAFTLGLACFSSLAGAQCNPTGCIGTGTAAIVDAYPNHTGNRAGLGFLDRSISEKAIGILCAVAQGDSDEKTQT